MIIWASCFRLLYALSEGITSTEAKILEGAVKLTDKKLTVFWLKLVLKQKEESPSKVKTKE